MEPEEIVSVVDVVVVEDDSEANRTPTRTEQYQEQEIENCNLKNNKPTDGKDIEIKANDECLVKPRGKKRKKPANRHFQTRWTECFGFIEVEGRALCVFCQETVVRRTYNVQRHFKSLHDKHFKDEVKKKESIELAVNAIREQQRSIAEETANHLAAAENKSDENKSSKTEASAVNTAEIMTETSRILSMCISEKGKPLTEGEFIKSVFIACAENLFEDFNNKDEILMRIKDLPASAKTMQSRLTDIESDVRNQQSLNLVKCDTFSMVVILTGNSSSSSSSLIINDDTNNSSSSSSSSKNTAAVGFFLTVYVRYVINAKIHEELCFQKRIDKSNGGDVDENILEIIVEHFQQRNVDIVKIASIMTTVDNWTGFNTNNIKQQQQQQQSQVTCSNNWIQLLEDKVKHSIVCLPCVIRQEELCAQISSGHLNDVMNMVIKVINYLITNQTTEQNEKLTSIIREVEKIDGGFGNVHWLGNKNNKSLEHFLQSLDDIRSFFGEKWQTYPELWNDFWLLKLSFLADFIEHLNDLNDRLNCRGQTIELLYEQFKLFTTKLAVFRRDIQLATFRYFPHLRKFFTSKGAAVDILHTIDAYMASLEQIFYERLQELQLFGPMFSFIVRAEELMDITFDPRYVSWLGVTDNLEMELLELKVSDLWSSKFRQLRRSLELLQQDRLIERESTILECWLSIPDQKFSQIKRLALTLLTFFGSTDSVRSPIDQNYIINQTSKAFRLIKSIPNGNQKTQNGAATSKT